MAFKNFPSPLRFKVIETSETVCAGSFLLPRSLDLAQIVMVLEKHGAHVGTEKLRAKLFHDKAMTKSFAVGSWMKLTTVIPDLSSSDWIGRFPLDFSRVQIPAECPVWLAVEASGYTRSGDTFYLQLAFDWGLNMHGVPAALAFELYGERWL